MTIKKEATSEELTSTIIKGMQGKKAEDIVILDLKQVKNSIADYFVICSGTSDTHIDAISDSIDKQVSSELNENPWHREGLENKEWILLDYIDVVAHIFKRDLREFYKLEDLWGDADSTPIEMAS